MPTENRSSSNPGARTFTLDSLVAALEQVQALHEISADLIAERIFGQPVEQHQGEPVHMVRSHGSFCWEESSGEGLDIALSMPEEYEVRCLYDRPITADAGEVERLRAELTEMTKSYEALGAVYSGTQKGFERLQAERNALLHEWRNSKGMTLEQSISLIERIEAALSASADPEERS